MFPKRLKLQATLTKFNFSRIQLIVFALIFGSVGGYAVWRSFADSCPTITTQAPPGYCTGSIISVTPSTLGSGIFGSGGTALSPGDVVIFEDGIYTDEPGGNDAVVQINTGGSLSAYVTFIARNKWGAKFDGQNNASKYGFNFGNNANYSHIDGFDIYGFGSSDTNLAPIAAAINASAGGGSSNIVNNHVHHIGNSCNPTIRTQAGIFIEQLNVHVERNVVNNIGRFPTSTGCTSTGFESNDYGIGLANANVLGTNYPGADGTKVINNIFYSQTSGMPMYLYAGTMSNIKILNNTFANGNPTSWYHTHIFFDTYMTDVEVKNNIFHEPLGGYRFVWDRETPTRVSITNNIGNGVVGKIIDGGGDGPVNIPSGMTDQDNQFNIDPKFIEVNSPLNGGLRLQSTSPAKDAGTNLASLGVTTDYDGNSRPQGSAFDIGAYEYVTGGGDITPPAVSITAPTGGSTVSGSSVTVSASATDNVGVQGVQFKLDGANLNSEDTTSPYSISWNTTTASNGSHSLTAVARDAAGNSTTSSGVTVTVSNGGGQTFYVATTGSDSNPGTESLPWRTVQKAANTLQPGQTALVRAGTYNESITYSNDSATNWITIQGEAGAVVDSSSGSTFSINGNFLRIRNLKIVGVPSQTTCISVNDAQHDIEILENEVTGCGDQAIYTGDGSQTPATASHRVTIARNLIHDTGGHRTASGQSNGIYLQGHDHRVESNVLYNLIDGHGIQAYDYDVNARVINNTVVNADHSGITIGGNTNGLFVGNIVYGNGTDGIHRSSQTNSSCSIHHNISFNNAEDEYDTGWPSGCFGSNNLIVDPQFVNYAVRDLRLASGSPGIDASDSSIFAQLAFNGVSRPQGPTPDIGAYESVSGGPAASMYLEPASGTAIVGGSFIVSIRERETGSVSGVNAVRARITYPAGKLSVSSISTTAPFSVVANNQFGGGVIDISRGSLSPVTGDQLVANINFTVLSAASVSVDFDIANSDVIDAATSQDILTSVANGSYDLLPPSDTTPPTVSMTAPANGATVSGSNVSVTATASDNVGVAGVQFKMDGNNQGAEDTSSPYSISWDTTTLGNGNHTLTAVARDTAGNTTTATTITVTVNNPPPPPDTTPPTVPTNLHSTAVGTTSISLAWNASTDSGGSGLAGYKLYRSVSGGAFSFLTSTTLLTYTNNGLTPNTAYSYKITAYDNADNESAQSAAVNVTTNINPPTVSLSANPTTINSGSSSTLTWSTTNATSCTASGAWSGNKATSGSQSTGALTNSATYNLSCSGPGGSAQVSATVTVNGSQPPPPPSIRPGDCNNTGRVDLTDLSILLSNYAAHTTTCDFNGDSTITITDLSILLSNYGR